MYKFLVALFLIENFMIVNHQFHVSNTFWPFPTRKNCAIRLFQLTKITVRKKFNVLYKPAITQQQKRKVGHAISITMFPMFTIFWTSLIIDCTLFIKNHWFNTVRIFRLEKILFCFLTQILLISINSLWINSIFTSKPARKDKFHQFSASIRLLDFSHSNCLIFNDILFQSNK